MHHRDAEGTELTDDRRRRRSPAVVMRNGSSRACADEAPTIVVHRRAPHMWVAPRSSMADQMASARTCTQTNVCPRCRGHRPRRAHQPLQWNIGSVHR